MAWATAETASGHVAMDPAIGNLRALTFRFDGRAVSPLHTAPWVDNPDETPGDDVLPVEAKLAGDFLCMPFGAADLDDTPAHGWTANSAWRVLVQQDGALSFELERPVMGARVRKHLRLAADAPLLYQTHDITGGEGRVTLAHHPMIRMAGRGRLSVSPKRAALTPDVPLERGRHRLALGQRVSDLARLCAVDGWEIDVTDLPIAQRHEDFLTLVEAPDSRLGWSAVLREVEDDIVFVLKNPDTLPVTMFWHSNCGRDYAPWNGRHDGVLGIEDGRAAGSAGHCAALGDNPVAAEGVPTTFTLGSALRIAHVIGAVPRPQGWRRVQDIAARNGSLTLTDISGATLSLPFDTDFLTKEP